MMTRLFKLCAISMVLHCATSTIVTAQELYKWVEPDGSITFSVTKPTNGVEYELISSMNDKGPEKAAKSTAQSSSDEAPSNVVQNSDDLPSIGATADSSPNLQVAPLTVQPARGISAANSNQPVIGAAARDRLPSQEDAADTPDIAPSVSNKLRQCEDLKKRMVSLERRLKNRLTPADMDNTVVYIARYQRSYDHHCAQ